jgi:hypothetical protein
MTLLQYARVAGVHMEDIVDDNLDLPEKLPCKVIIGHQTQICISKNKPVARGRQISFAANLSAPSTGRARHFGDRHEV